MLNKRHSFLIFIILFHCGLVQAKPYLPKNPDQILEKLPQSFSATTPLRQLRLQLSQNPNDVDLATQLAKIYIEQSRQEGDPRYLGYAEAALAPWWKLPTPPGKVIILRATLLQSTHHFDLALSDLDTILASDPNNGQAWITRATVLQVQGNYAQALKSCAKLAELAPALITSTCNNSIRHLYGEARQSYTALKIAYEEKSDNDSATDIWILTLLAEMATRLGDNAAAEQHFLAAIKIEDPDSYLLGAYADFLLDEQRAPEVVSLLKTKTRIDPLLLRYAEALDKLASKDAPLQIQRLRQTFAAAAMRGDTVHQREQARFELRLLHNPKRALQLAKQNWQVQKEPADARIYLESALASNNAQEIKVVNDWLQKNNLQDIALQRLMLTAKIQ